MKKFKKYFLQIFLNLNLNQQKKIKTNHHKNANTRFYLLFYKYISFAFTN